MRVGKLKNGKATGNDEITGEMIKGGGDRVVDWILCLKSGDLLCLFYYPRVKERGLNVRTIKVLVVKCGWKIICGDAGERTREKKESMCGFYRFGEAVR